MKRCVPLAVLAVAFLVQPAGAQERRLAFSLPGMDEVQRIADLPYRSLAGSPDTVRYGPELRYDVFVPASASDGLQGGVLFIHGGLAPGTERVSPKDLLPAYEQWGRLVAAAGLVGITFSHRMTTDDDAEKAAGDVEALLREVERRAPGWRLDPRRLCVAVFSAGGPLASLFLAEGGHPIRCLALYYPFLDVEHAAAHSLFRMAHPPERVAALRRFSPRERILASAGDLPPMLLARAGRDAIPGINASIDRFVQAALWVDAPLDLHIHPTGNHGFDMTATPDPRATEIVAATLAFFRRHLETGA
ncbi:MAG: alpha/beta hydrolase [Gemmatimonadetes bacterium]|nr:alpha/beta hydrolase [Gemmatimonadota bacterium]